MIRHLITSAKPATIWFVIITIAGFKGGVGKSTTAFHLAYYFGGKAPTALVDGDPNRSVTLWASRGSQNFTIVGEHESAKAYREHEHLVIDTKARPDPEDLEALAKGCDLLILPCTPDPLALDAMMQTITALQKVGSAKYRILLTIVPPRPMPDGDNARQAISHAGMPLLAAEIRRTVAFQRAALAGMTVDKLRTELAYVAWMDYERVGEEIEGIYAESKSVSGSGSGRSTGQAAR